MSAPVTLRLLAGARGALRAALGAAPSERRQAGQAMIESALLLFTLLGVTTVAGLWLVRRQPQLLNALDLYVRGFYYMLSLPFP